MTLQLQGAAAGYGGTDVLRDVSIDLRPGECLAVLGPNGAGKSTLLRAMSGQLRLRRGQRLLDGASITSWRPHEAARHGIRWVGEPRPVYPNLSIEDNLAVGGIRNRQRFVEQRALVFEHFPILEERRAQPAGALSGGQQQMLAIGQALMSEPRYLCLDEPSMGLSPHMVTAIAQVIHRLAASGVAVLWAEQYPDVALKHADRAAIMSAGRVITVDHAGDLSRDALEAAYLGDTARAERLAEIHA